MKKTSVIVLSVALTTLTSCIGRSATTPSSATGSSNVSEHVQLNEDNPRALIVLADATGSYGELVPALRRLARFAGEELKPGDTFCAFWVKGEIGESPDFIVEPITLPVPQRRIGDPAAIDVLQFKKQVQTTLNEYASGRAFKKTNRTDLVQSIAYAGRMLRAGTNVSREKWLLLFTDLEDNQNRPVPLNVDGVHVRVFYVPARNDLSNLEKKIKDWRQRFTDAKAASVSIYDVGQSRALALLITDEAKSTK